MMKKNIAELSLFKQFLPLQVFIQKYRQGKKAIIPAQEISTLAAIVYRCCRIQINFNHNNPLSLMETLTLAISIAVRSYEDQVKILGISRETLRTYEKRVKAKLCVQSKLQAIANAVSRGIIRV